LRRLEGRPIWFLDGLPDGRTEWCLFHSTFWPVHSCVLFAIIGR
jgi:hypothetical protein